MKIVELQQNTSEWLEFRKNKIGASDATIIMNESPWASPMQLWERKLGISQEQKESFCMSKGKALEHEARCSFMQLKGISVTPEVIEHPEYEFLIASLDGLSACQQYAVEIKCPGREDHLSALQGVVPKKYIPQIQHQLEVTGLNMIYYYSYDGQNNACIEVKKDEKYINNLIKEELKFYKYMITCTPPELSDRDYNIRHDKQWDYAARNWKDAKQRLDHYTLVESQMRKELIEASQSRNSKGFGVKVQKIIRAGSVEYSKIKELQGIDLDKYRKQASESWRITLDGE